MSVDNLLDDEDMITTNSSLLEVKNVVEHIATHFRKPLNAEGIFLPDEVEEIPEFGTNYAHVQISTNGLTSSYLWSCASVYLILMGE